jgi:hypothetical protein
MDDLNALERQIEGQLNGFVGPVFPVDDAAIFNDITAACRQKGRGFTMFSALKFVAASVIVTLFGGLVLAGIFTTQQGDEMAPAAESASAPSPSPAGEITALEAPSEFRARFACSTYWEDGQTRNVVMGPIGDGNLVRRETRGELGRFEAEADDPRLQGDWTVYSASDEYFWPGVDPNLPLIFAPGVLHISNDQGSWEMPWGHFALPGSMDVGELDGIAYLLGAGEYDGLTAVFRMTSENWEDCHCFTAKGYTATSERCRFEMAGLIVEGVPPTPEIPH